jgi:phosphonate transport system ATP-binding protein
VLGELHRICREDRITAIVSLHQVELARRFGDRVIGLNRGQVVFDGTPGQLNGRAFDQIYETDPPLVAQAAE